MKRWTGWGVAIFFFGLACQATADTDWCYKYLQQGENDKAIEACTKELRSGQYDGEKEVMASRLYYRGTAYFNKLGKGNYDKAIADLTKAIGLIPDDISAYNTRGSAYLCSGRYDRAIDDFTRLFSLNHMRSAQLPYFENRGTAYWLKGDYGKALADFTKGITQGEGLGKSDYWIVRNDLNFLYEFRGDAYYSTGDFEKAVADYAKVIADGSYGCYLQLRTWLALKKLSDERADGYREELLASAKSGGWPGIVVKYYLGLDGVTENEVLEKARQEDDEMSRRGRLCEAYYYLGEGRLMRGDRKGAAAFFEKSAATEYRYRSSEKFISKVLLARMKKHKDSPDRRHNMGKIRWLPR